MLCPTGKENYLTKMVADRRAEYARIRNKKKKKVGIFLTGYKCPFCPFWHLTSAQPKPPKPKEEKHEARR